VCGTRLPVDKPRGFSSNFWIVVFSMACGSDKNSLDFAHRPFLSVTPLAPSACAATDHGCEGWAVTARPGFSFSIGL